MIEALYGELGPEEKERFAVHLRSCPECASEYAGLEATLRIMDKRERPDPGPEFWDGYWDRLSRRMLWESIGEDRKPSFVARLVRPLARLPRWTLQAVGAAALLILGILAGSRLIPPSGGSRSGTAAVAVPSGAVVQAESFIERSKVLLLGLVNYDPATEDASYAFDLGHKKTASRGLRTSARCFFVTVITIGIIQVRRMPSGICSDTPTCPSSSGTCRRRCTGRRSR
jgi:hypothetical protein